MSINRRQVLGWFRWCVLGQALLLGACGVRNKPRGPMEVVATGLPLDSLLPLVRRVTLQETPAAAVGSLVNLAFDSSGRIFAADFGMRNVKVYDRSGAYIRTLGAQGRGPGEYVMPVFVTLSSRDRRVGVVDVAQRRLAVYDRDSYKSIQTMQLESPVSLSSATFGIGETLFVAGVDRLQKMPAVFGAALLAGARTTVRGLVPVPARLQGKALSDNSLHAVMAQSDHYVFFALNASGTLYRADLSGTVRDSMVLPLAIYRGIELLELRDWRHSPNAIGDYMMTQPWIEAVQPLSDSILVVEVLNPARTRDEIRRSFAIVSWTGDGRIWTTAPCRCRLEGGLGDTVAVIQADSTGGSPVIDWRVGRRR